MAFWSKCIFGGMKVRIEELEALGFVKVTDGEGEIIHGYTCDLLSEVMGKAKSGTVWITVQSHVNIIAVSVIAGVRAIVLCDGRDYENETIEKAKNERIALFKTDLNSFEVSGKIYGLGVK
jgi:hypothetical protein